MDAMGWDSGLDAMKKRSVLSHEMLDLLGDNSKTRESFSVCMYNYVCLYLNSTRVVKLLLCAYYYYDYYYFIYLNSLLLLLLRHIFKRPITITITITGKVWGAYYYYYYFYSKH